MKNIKRILTSVMLALVLAVPTASVLITATATTGCSIIQPGNSSVVVRAEQLSQASFEVVDSFLRFEKANRDQLWAANPEIKKTADRLRAKFPPANMTLRTAIKVYKSERNDVNLSALEKSMAVVEFLRSEAVKWHGIATVE